MAARLTSVTSPAHSIEAVGLTKRYGDVRALDGLDLFAPAGKVTAVLGPNGAGKTTFIKRSNRRSPGARTSS